MKIRPLIGRLIRISGRLHVNQPLLNFSERLRRTSWKRIREQAQSLGSQDYYRKSRMTILGLAGVFFCENEQAKTKWIIICSEENTYLDAWGSQGRS